MGSGSSMCPKKRQLGVTLFFSPHISAVGPFIPGYQPPDIAHPCLHTLWCVSEHPVATWMLSPASGGSKAAVGNTHRALGQREHPAQAVPFPGIRWDGSQKTSSTCLLSFYFFIFFIDAFPVCLEKYMAPFPYAWECSNMIETFFWKAHQPCISINYCWFCCLSILAMFLAFFKGTCLTGVGLQFKWYLL